MGKAQGDMDSFIRFFELLFRYWFVYLFISVLVYLFLADTVWGGLAMDILVAFIVLSIVRLCFWVYKFMDGVVGGGYCG